MRSHSLAAFLLLFFLPAAAAAQTIWYVKGNATGLNNGTSWDNAFIQLQPALNTTQPGDQVWVAGGIYHPQQPADGVSTIPQDRAFVLPAGVKIYGRFQGTEPAGFDLLQRSFLPKTTPVKHLVAGW